MARAYRVPTSSLRYRPLEGAAQPPSAELTSRWERTADGTYSSRHANPDPNSNPNQARPACRGLAIVLMARLEELECLQLVAALLEALGDLADQAALDAVRFDHDVRALVPAHAHAAAAKHRSTRAARKRCTRKTGQGVSRSGFGGGRAGAGMCARGRVPAPAVHADAVPAAKRTSEVGDSMDVGENAEKGAAISRGE